MSSPVDRHHPHYNRKLKGTPAYKFRHHFALTGVLIGSLIGTTFFYFGRKYKIFDRPLFEDSPETIIKKTIFQSSINFTDPEVIKDQQEKKSYLG